MIPTIRPDASEATIQRVVLAHLGALAPRAFFWRANTGGAQTSRGYIKFGLPGQADILGLAGPNGRLIAIELKTETGRQSKEQKAFQAQIETAGGLYILARSLGEALDPVRRVLQGEL